MASVSPRQWIGVFHNLFAKLPIVSREPIGSILFGDHDYEETYQGSLVSVDAICSMSIGHPSGALADGACVACVNGVLHQVGSIYIIKGDRKAECVK